MSNEIRDRTADHRQAEQAADLWIGNYSWCQQAGLPDDFNRTLKAMWMHGFMAGLDAGRAADQPSPARAYYETHEPPHCPTCACGTADNGTAEPT